MTKRNKQLREIYLLAAASQAEEWQYNCIAIRRAWAKLNLPMKEALDVFQFLYSPYPGALFFWPQEEFGTEVCQQNRIFALLFLAELARTDSLPTLSEIQSA